MTENYPPPTMPPPGFSDPLPPEPVGDQQPGTADVVRGQAADLGHSGVEAGKHTAGVAQEQASQVVAEATRQGRDLLRQAQGQLGDQAATGQQRLADELTSLGDELTSMADGSEQNGVAAELARQAASRARGAGQWLSDRQPSQVIEDVQAFARRRPGVFLAVAVGVGLVGGRLTRGLKSASSEDDTTPPFAGTGLADGPTDAYGSVTPDGSVAAVVTDTAVVPDAAVTPAAPLPPLPADEPDLGSQWAEPTAETGYQPAADTGYEPADAGYEPAPDPDAQQAADTAGQPESDVVAGDDGSAIPLVDGLPAATGSATWDNPTGDPELGQDTDPADRAEWR